MGDGLERPVISVDLDGTIADSHSRWLEVGKERYGITETVDDLVLYDFWRITGPDSEEEFMQVWRDLWDDYGKIKPQPGVQAALEELHKTCTIYINSACVGRLDNVKSWLKDNDIVYDHFNLASSEEEKFDLKTDLHFEDSPRLVEGFAERGRNVVVISQPWNRELRGWIGKYRNVRIAKDWDDAKRIALDHSANFVQR
ncbi:MAG: 5' nucleotidase, NT5C type [Candidatus Micrarchaeaceae archaeon]